jgi:hypothetical protein
MAKDIYDLDKGGNAKKRLLTSHDKPTKLKIDGNDIRMVQDATVQYQQRTEARFEVGFEFLYWACGQSQGQLTCNKLVAQKGAAGGKGGVWKGLKKGMKAGGANGGANVKLVLKTDNGGVKGDGVCQNATVSFNVGNMAIQDNSTWSVGHLEKI